MDCKRIGSLRVEVLRGEVTFVNEAVGVTLCIAEIIPAAGSLRDQVRLISGQSIRRSYRPGLYNVVVMTIDLLGIVSKIGKLLGLPIGPSPLTSYMMGRIGKDPKDLGINDIIACYEGTEYVERLVLGTEKPEFVTQVLDAVKLAVSHLPTKGWFYIDDDQEPPPDPPDPRREATALEQPKETYKDSYQDEGGSLFERLFRRRNSTV
jgi:hypothetical protein